MNYEIKMASKEDKSRLIDYKLKTIMEYSDDLSETEIIKIKDYVNKNIHTQLENYKVICVNDKKVGCLLVTSKNDGVLLDEIYLEEEYRNKGIGTNLIKKVIASNPIVYLWVYKLNTQAIALYKHLGFKIIEKTETRYYMMYKDCTNN